MIALKTKKQMSEPERMKFELDLQTQFNDAYDGTKQDLNVRLNGVPNRAGSTGFQFVGYTVLERMYRGDQWGADEPRGASQRTDNYCAIIVDNISSLIFDDHPEINCPVGDPSDELQTVKAEARERLLWKVYKDNDYETEFDEWAKVASLYGDGFLKGPWIEKDPDTDKYVIKFAHVENPGAIRLLFKDASFKKLLGFIDETRVALSTAKRLYGKEAAARDIKLQDNIRSVNQNRRDSDTTIPMVDIQEFWTGNVQSTFINKKLLSYAIHNWGFVPLRYVKNTYVPNHPYGKSDIEDVIDPQLFYNRVNNDLGNLLRWISTVNMWGKNLEGMQALVAGLSRIYSLPDEGEIHTFEKPGDPYITNTFAQQRRTAIIEISGVSEALLSSSQASASSGRALALAFQGTIRKLNPRMKRFSVELRHLNSDILKLYEIYFPKTKKIIDGNYDTDVFLQQTILRNVVDTINKLQSGIISLDTAQKEAGVRQPKMEQKVMKKNLEDPILGKQIARQPSLLPQLNSGDNQEGDQPNPAPGNSPQSSPGGAVQANNQQSSGAAPVPRGKK